MGKSFKEKLLDKFEAQGGLDLRDRNSIIRQTALITLDQTLNEVEKRILRWFEKDMPKYIIVKPHLSGSNTFTKLWNDYKKQEKSEFKVIIKELRE